MQLVEIKNKFSEFNLFCKYLTHKRKRREREKLLKKNKKDADEEAVQQRINYLLITVLQDCKIRHTNLSMVWIDYKKAYDFALHHSWSNECMELFTIAENVRKFLEKSMEQWKLSMTSNGEDLGEGDVKRGIFQGDSLSPLLFVLSMVPLSLILRKVNASYEWGKKECKLNHLLFMDDFKLFSDTLVRTVHVFSTHIGMEFGMKKCGILTRKRG